MAMKPLQNYPYSKKQTPANSHFQSHTNGQDNAKMLMAKATDCFKRKDYKNAVKYLDEILSSNPRNQFAISKIIQCFSRMNRIDYAEEEYRDALELGVADLFIHNAMLDAYAKAGRIKEAENIYYNKLGDKADVVSHSAMLDAYAKAGRIEEAENIYYNKLGDKANVVSHSAMLDAYAKAGRIEEAESVYIQLGSQADIVSHNAMLDAYAKAGRIKEAENIYYNKLGDKADVVSHNAMLDAYAKAGMLDKAKVIYKYLCSSIQADIVTHCIMAYAYYGCCRYQEALDFIALLPAEVGVLPTMELVRLDVMRKMGKREEVLNELGALLPSMPVNYSNPEYILARTIHAYCQNDSGDKKNAYLNFRELYLKVAPVCEHYPRILCGLVFASRNGEFSRVDADKLRTRFLALLKANNFNKGMKEDMEGAFHLLKTTAS